MTSSVFKSRNITPVGKNVTDMLDKIWAVLREGHGPDWKPSNWWQGVAYRRLIKELKK